MAMGQVDVWRGNERRVGQALLLLCLVSYAFVIPRGPDHNPDSRLALTYSLVERGSLAIDDFVGTTRDRAYRDRHYYSDKAPGVSFWLAPIYAVVRLLPLPSELSEDRFVTRYLLTFLGVGVPSAVFAVWLFHWLRRLAPDPVPRAAAVLGYALGSPVYAYSVHAFGHVPAGICLFVGAVRLCRAGRGAVLSAGLALGSAVVFEYPALLPATLLAAIGVGAADGGRIRRATLLFAGAAVPLAALALYQTLAFGAPWVTGYSFLDPAGGFAEVKAVGFMGVGVPSIAVAAQLLGGPKRGLLVVAPWLVLCVPGALLAWRSRSPRSRRWVVRAAAVFGALLVVNSGYAVWDGGAAWGPRHVTPAIPFLVVLAVPAFTRWPRVAWGLVAVSIVLTAVGVSTGTLPPPDAPSTLADFLLPTLREGRIGNTLGQALGLSAWRALVPLAAVALLLLVWVRGVSRTYGIAAVSALALASAATLDRRYVEYAEGYYLYLGARIAAGAAFYGEVASTQTPLLPLAIAALWQIVPSVYAPRLLALASYAVASLLAGRLAARLSGRPGTAQLGTTLAALLPLGATVPHALDANALLAPLGPAVALLLLTTTRGGAAMAALVAGGGVAIKLTFLPLALAPLVALRRRLVPYGVVMLAFGAVGTAACAARFGPRALDGLFGELESPILPAGAALAVLQFAWVEGLALVFAAIGWWQLRARLELRPVQVLALCAALMPLLGLHQGTFVSVARPAEPFLAAYAACGIVWLAELAPRLGRVAAPALTVLALTMPVAAIFQGRTSLSGPSDAPLGWTERDARREVLAPPYFAALTERVMPHDYADWTVLGMRAAAGVEPEARYAAQLVGDLERAAFPLVVADFRLAYVPGAMAALERRYALVARDGSGPLEVALWLPRLSVAGTAKSASAISGQMMRLSPGHNAEQSAVNAEATRSVVDAVHSHRSPYVATPRSAGIITSRSSTLFHS